MNVQIVLFDGFDVLDALAPYEVFMAAATYSKETINVELVSAEGAREVISGDNYLKLQASSKLDVSRQGILIIPGASGPLDDADPNSVPMKLKRATETPLGQLLKKAWAQPDLLIATVCGGSLILAMNDLLEGRHAATHHMGMELLNATGASAVHARVVDDIQLISSGGVTSGLDLSLYLIERELGPHIAIEVEHLLEYERRGTVWKSSEKVPTDTFQRSSELGSPLPATHEPNEASTFMGKWDTLISTPIGKLSVLFDLACKDGQIIGTAKQGQEEATPLINPIQEGDRFMWKLKVTKPMRLSLHFNVSIKGDTMIGEAKAGMLPASKLTGQRIS
ncbi:hypothetical protein GCM10011391_37620 [Pullulanibacillus camelliae]|uniref:DJ-1/PfpI domain-containing protein n=1 Tax=Pullulanibacillus camelliae TaxID=1707096 RepID=A0A8J3DZL3_9BACL|nr:DJ-1/PfpI family protein [Pullulanibacillus camelliae]GGE55106.1 hypothetical protein GCM10011391_37620 [Pullulanibacillus camelliae]